MKAPADPALLTAQPAFLISIFRKISFLLILVLPVVILLTACGNDPTATSQPQPTQPSTPTATSQAFIETPAPSQPFSITPVPTVTPQPTPTTVPPTPTTEPPTSTPAPTATATAIPPTNTPQGRTLALKPLFTIPATPRQDSRVVAFSPDNRTFVSAASKDTLKLRDAATGRELVNYKHDFEVVTSVDFSPDGKTLLAAGQRDPDLIGPYEVVKFWNVADGKPLPALSAKLRHIRWAFFSPDGKSIAVLWEVFDDPHHISLEMLDYPSFQPGNEIDLGECDSTSLSLDVKMIAAGCPGGTVNVRYLASSKEVNFNSLGGIVPYLVIYRLAFSNDGQLLATHTGSDDSKEGKIKVWDTETGKELAGFVGHKLPVYAMTFSHIAKIFASASFDGTLKLWDVDTRRALFSFNAPQQIKAMAISASDGYFAAVQEDGSVRLWQVTN